MATTTTDIVHLNAPSNFPIKLTPLNFPVWRRQVQSTLIGFNLLGYIDGSVKEQAKFNDVAQTTPNPAHLTWYCQDQIITSALLGSCSDTIQLLIGSTSTACDARQRLVASNASASRGRILSLKAKLTRNSKGNRSVTAFLNDMRSIAVDLALAQCPISDEDMVVYILTQLGDEYSSIVSVVRIRDKHINLGELADALTDHKRQLAEVDDARKSILATANASQRGPSASRNIQHSTAIEGPATTPTTRMEIIDRIGRITATLDLVLCVNSVTLLAMKHVFAVS
ncbi:PREDICTED: uncharacterized protein LOC109154176 [Ipomoea nil]|uniref:uncharacterized protein LOC109154176 n=1 Tax=Ipomoea nil TaxID=35883 RepID=UPI00090133E7|nr:PREDICTED: uncharacterized protein LOC109154176 [Ipomoea nil]